MAANKNNKVNMADIVSKAQKNIHKKKTPKAASPNKNADLPQDTAAVPQNKMSINNHTKPSLEQDVHYIKDHIVSILCDNIKEIHHQSAKISHEINAKQQNQLKVINDIKSNSLKSFTSFSTNYFDMINQCSQASLDILSNQWHLLFKYYNNK